jgi:hypothetical protein
MRAPSRLYAVFGWLIVAIGTLPDDASAFLDGNAIPVVQMIRVRPRFSKAFACLSPRILRVDGRCGAAADVIAIGL